MITQDELPGFLLDALDKPLVGPIAVIVLGLAVVLFLAWLWDKYTARELDRHHLRAKIARPEAEFESTASHWHKPPVQMWTDDEEDGDQPH